MWAYAISLGEYGMVLMQIWFTEPWQAYGPDHTLCCDFDVCLPLEMGEVCEKCVASPYEHAQRVYFLSCLETLSNMIRGLSFLSENRQQHDSRLRKPANACSLMQLCHLVRRLTPALSMSSSFPWSAARQPGASTRRVLHKWDLSGAREKIQCEL